MGVAPSTGPASPETIRLLFDRTNCFEASRSIFNDGGPSNEAIGCDALAAYCILGGAPERFSRAQAALSHVRSQAADPDEATRILNRSLGCVLGNAIGDALGAPLEFASVRYGSKELTSMCQDEIWLSPNAYNSFCLKPGQWTDDNSMALCLVDSLLCCGGFDAIDLRQRFFLWVHFGYNNAFGRDPERRTKASVGLGGNISSSILEWKNESPRTPETSAGDKFTSGNGSVMRNSGIPVWFRDDLEAGMAAAYQQSKTTHGGDEAAELCRLLTFICIHFIRGSGREFLEDLSAFRTPLYSVSCLAAAQCEEEHEQNANPIFGGLENRRWDWRSREYRYCETRAKEQPGYVGSYAMDAVSMALHCVYSTDTFEAATLKAANLRGDSDSVCAVVGQLAGALYGASAIPEEWWEKVQQWDGGSIAARALMLHDHEMQPANLALSQVACATAALLGTCYETAVEWSDWCHG